MNTPIFPLITGLKFSILIWKQRVTKYYNPLCGEDITKLSPTDRYWIYATEKWNKPGDGGHGFQTQAV